MTAIPPAYVVFLYWSVSLFCILNHRPHQTQLASSIVALRAARWRACVCVVRRVVGYKDEVLRHKLDHISFNRPLLFFISKESFNYDLFIHPVFVFCLLHRHRDTHVRVCTLTHTHRISVRVLIARLSARKPSVWRCCGRQWKQQHGYSNEHPIMPAKSHFCVAHTGAKLHSFDLKPLLTQLCRWVISPGDWQGPETMPQALSARSSSFYISLGPSLNTLHSLRKWRGTKGEGYKLLIMMPD